MVARLPPSLGWEIASVERNIFHPFVGRLLLNEDGTLATRGGMLGLRIYDDLERDPRVFSVMQKRKLALAAYPWQVDGESKRACKLVEKHLKGMNFIETTTGLLDAILKGFSVGEVMWEIDGAEIRPKKVIMRDQRRFRFDVEYQIHLLTYSNMLVGEDLPPRKFVTHSYGAKDGSPYGLGLGTRLFWCVFFKRQDIGFWLGFLDKFGSPTTVGKYPPNATPELKQKLLDALEAIAQETGIIIPEGMMVELLEAERAGSNDGYEKLARYMDEQIAEAVLGETLTTNIGDVGSKAAGSVHNDVRLELTQADAELLAASLNESLVKWIVDLNMPGTAYPKLSWAVQQPDDLGARADRDAKIYQLGFKPTLKYITETYGGEWEERQVQAPPAVDPEQEDPTFAARSPWPPEWMALMSAARKGAAFAEGVSDGRGLVAANAERLALAASPAIEAMAARIGQLLDEVGSLEEMRDRLIELYPDLDAESFARAMEQAVTACDLAGRYIVKEA